jgi:hypothetical protein
MKSKSIKILIGLVGVVVLYQGAKWGYGEAAQAYFNYRCEQDAGEFIYRTVEDVEGVFQMRPREKGEYFSRLRRGDLMEDPYGHTNREAKSPWYMFLQYPNKPTYSFFESTLEPDFKEYELRKHMSPFIERPNKTGEPYWIYKISAIRRENSSKSFRTMLNASQTSKLRSQYGFTWQQVQNNGDKFFGVIGGELIVKELATDEILAVRRGFFFWPPWSKRGGICPKGKTENLIFNFISKVLIPSNFNDSEVDEYEF